MEGCLICINYISLFLSVYLARLSLSLVGWSVTLDKAWFDYSREIRNVFVHYNIDI